jgi:hypothetical protein
MFKRILQPLSILAASVAVLVSMAGQASAATATVSLSATDSIAVGNGLANPFAGTGLFVGSQSQTTSYGDQRSWLKFDLSSLPGNRVVTSATLNLFNYYNMVNPQQVEVYGGTSNSWTASTITWGNQAALGTAALATTPVQARVAWYSWDVTSFVNQNSTGDSLVSLVLKAQAENGTTNYAAFFRNTYISQTPVLTVTYDVTPTPIPAAAWLLGSGLLSLVGIKRKNNA